MLCSRDIFNMSDDWSCYLALAEHSILGLYLIRPLGSFIHFYENYYYITLGSRHSAVRLLISGSIHKCGSNLVISLSAYILAPNDTSWARDTVKTTHLDIAVSNTPRNAMGWLNSSTRLRHSERLTRFSGILRHFECEHCFFHAIKHYWLEKLTLGKRKVWHIF